MTGMRRSARLQRLSTTDTQITARSDASASAPAPAKGKTATSRGAAKKKKPAKPKVHVAAGPASSKDLISSLPPEIMAMILEVIDHRPSMSALGRTSKGFHDVTMPHLYSRVILHANCHAQIAKFIRTLEPLLTVAQKKQLMREGKYKGQQLAGYPAGLDEQARPSCARHVRQLVVGRADPGRKHDFILVRYIEEAFRTLENLEIIQTWNLNAVMAQSIASLKYLQALSIGIQSLSQDRATAKALRRVKNLKHLSLQTSDQDPWTSGDNVAQSLIRNSATTLRSLLLRSASRWTRFFPDREKTDSVDTQYRLTMLRSLRLMSINLGHENVEAMLESVDFTKLEDLAIGLLDGESDSVLDHLTALFGAAPPSLRSLSISLVESVETRTRFLSSFTTLTKLVLKDYVERDEDIPENSGLPDTLLHAILGHQNLEILILTFPHSTRTRLPLQHTSVQTIRAIVDGLPKLQDFVFDAAEENSNEIAQILTRARNLTSVTNLTYMSGLSRCSSKPYTPGFLFVRGIVQAFLDHPEISQVGEDFVWEDHLRLKQVSVSRRTWEVASKFGKGENGMLKPERLTGKTQDRGVWVRDVTDFKVPPLHMYGGCTWHLV
ncbi:hypothetical protein PG999_008253 [Apiospora kogelbergensis]|uniref:F-box domain-containing protein n=1 Tax=Apiospora kogelbergensis TaxID=1337665 RepID=A0AAW0QMU7_9PEZI